MHAEIETKALPTTPVATARLEDATPSRTASPLGRSTGQVRQQRGPWLQIVTQVLQLAGPRAEFIRHAERPWSSATFSGARHSVALTFTGAEAVADGEALIEALPEHEFTIPGHLVADATLRGVEQENSQPPRLALEIDILLLTDL